MKISIIETRYLASSKAIGLLSEDKYKCSKLYLIERQLNEEEYVGLSPSIIKSSVTSLEKINQN